MSGRARLLLAAVASLLLGLDRPSGLADVSSVRHWSYDGFTRVVVELNRPVTSTVKRLSKDPRAGRPARLYLDLPEVWVGLRYDKPIPVADGLLQGIRLGQNTLRNTRVVIDLQSYGRHRLFALTAPHRLVLDVYGRNRPAPSAPQRPGASPQGDGGRLPVALRPVQTWRSPSSWNVACAVAASRW
jgi:N-acetylmuramoyl-L-alanine amidase